MSETMRELLLRKCSTCGTQKEAWVDCNECGGDGDVEEPDWQEAMFEPYRTCGQCGGRGGWWLCEKCASPEALQEAR